MRNISSENEAKQAVLRKHVQCVSYDGLQHDTPQSYSQTNTTTNGKLKGIKSQLNPMDVKNLCILILVNSNFKIVLRTVDCSCIV